MSSANKTLTRPDSERHRSDGTGGVVGVLLGGQIVNAGEVDKAELVLISLMLTRLACVNLCHSQRAVQHLDSVNVPWIKYR